LEEWLNDQGVIQKHAEMAQKKLVVPFFCIVLYILESKIMALLGIDLPTEFIKWREIAAH
jgi:hypothetical protein